MLLIEDDEADAVLFRHQLPDEYQLSRVCSLEDALKTTEEDWDVLIVDLGLPGCDDLDALNRVHEWAPNLPVVVLTGHDDYGLAKRALRAGAQDYLVKGEQSSQDLCRAIRYSVERKSAQLALEEAQHKLKDAEKLDAIALLASGIAHDFNNLLVSINVNASLLTSNPDGEVQQAAKAILESGERAATLTRQLLGFSRSGQVIRRTVEVSELLRDVSERMEFEKPVDLQVQACSGGVLGDPTQLGRLFEDLVNNAVESYQTKTGQPVVLLQAERLDSQVQIRVIDYGSGIDPAIQDRVLEPFFTTKDFGLGLGLSNALGIALGHGGQLEVESAVNVGTKVTVRLPLCTKRPSARTPKTEGPTPPVADRGLILIVDDEQAVRETGRRVLTRFGFDVETSGSPRDSLEQLRTGSLSPDLILLDMIMPEMHGQSFLRQLREFNHEQAVIVCTGYSDLTLDEPDPHLDLLEKPYSIQELRAKIACLCPALIAP